MMVPERLWTASFRAWVTLTERRVCAVKLYLLLCTELVGNKVTPTTAVPAAPATAIRVRPRCAHGRQQTRRDSLSPLERLRTYNIVQRNIRQEVRRCPWGPGACECGTDVVAYLAAFLSLHAGHARYTYLYARRLSRRLRPRGFSMPRETRAVPAPLAPRRIALDAQAIRVWLIQSLQPLLWTSWVQLLHRLPGRGIRPRGRVLGE